MNSHRGRRAITEGFGVLSKKSTVYLGLFSVKIQPEALVVAPYYVLELRLFVVQHCKVVLVKTVCVSLFLYVCIHSPVCLYMSEIQRGENHRPSVCATIEDAVTHARTHAQQRALSSAFSFPAMFTLSSSS